jgi:hypothetical protein
MFVPLGGSDTTPVTQDYITKALLCEDIERKDFEHISNGAILFSFCNDLLKKYRLTNNGVDGLNKVIYEKNDIYDLFEQFEKQIDNEYAANSSTNPQYSSKQSNVETERNKEDDVLKSSMMEADNMSSCFKLIIDHNDEVLKNSLENKLNSFSLSEREKILHYFRNFPGVARYLMPKLALKEDNFRKARKCEIYPFLNNINIQLYEKYEVVNKFETLFNEATGRVFDFGYRIYQEPMNTDIIMQVLNNSILLDPEVIIHYNERDDNLLFATYYKCHKVGFTKTTSTDISQSQILRIVLTTSDRVIHMIKSYLFLHMSLLFRTQMINKNQPVKTLTMYLVVIASRSPVKSHQNKITLLSVFLTTAKFILYTTQTIHVSVRLGRRLSICLQLITVYL